jgi:hypothetical protein
MMISIGSSAHGERWMANAGKAGIRGDEFWISAWSTL